MTRDDATIPCLPLKVQTLNRFVPKTDRSFPIPLEDSIVELFVFFLASGISSGDSVSLPNSNLVREALTAEVDGDLQRRAALLAAAVEKDPNDSAAHWHRGEVFRNGTWRRASATRESMPSEAYQARQRESKLTGVEHLRLALWCKSHGMNREHDAELRVADRLAPDLPELQKPLGRTLKHGVWGTETERAARRNVRVLAEAATKRWIAILKALPAPPKNLPDLDDPYAIPVLERQLSLGSETAALLVVQKLREMNHQAATASLIRHAVFSNWKDVRAKAVECLHEKPSDDVVPALIEYLRPSDRMIRSFPGLGVAWVWQDYTRTYIHTMTSPIPTTIVPLVFSAIPKVDADSADILIVASIETAHLGGSIVKGDLGPEWDGDFLGLRDRIGLEKMELTEAKNQARLASAGKALVELTGMDFGADQMKWLTWWAEIHDQFFDASQTSEPTREIVESSPIRFVLHQQQSCFRAGTPVWTLQGLRPIDRIELGDLVLSQNASSGELSYKPVVFRTLRPRTRLRKLEIGGETLETTLGHPFWLVGKSWTFAKDLVPGGRIRTVEGVAALEAVSDGEPAQAYNLEVADFASYFVGKTGCLVHDNTPIHALPQKAPGLSSIKQSKHLSKIVD